jgi:LuxR family maltose regulon positive regulatory protein
VSTGREQGPGGRHGADRTVPFAPKFRFPPLRPGLVKRTRLIGELVEATGSLVVLAAPPGFGKSTLLAQWQECDPRAFAFVALEPSENDPVELWSCVVTSIRQRVPSFGNSVEPMLHSVGAIAIDPLVRRIAAEMDQLSEPVVVVLDDYEVIRNPACHASLAALTAHPTSKVRPVVATRADPPIPLGRLRASGELVEIRGRDLAFGPEETRELLTDATGHHPSEAELAILQARTEGWPAGLHLAAVGLRDQADPDSFLASFGGSNRHVVDYLTEVVLDSIDPDVRQYLLDTSILGQLSGPLCDAVTGHRDSASMLDRLERSNLFLIALDDQRKWYRYHHLFGELLRDQLQLATPERIPGLHKAASAWLADANRPDEAIEHAIAADELDAAANLVVSAWGARVASGRLTTVLGWLGAFPHGHVQGSAPLSIVSAWVHGLLGHDTAARRSIDHALAAGSAAPLPDGSRTVEHSADLFLTLFWLKTDAERARKAARSVQECRGEFRPEFQSVAAFAIGVGAFLGGDLRRARDEFQRAAEDAAATRAWLTVIDALGFGTQVALMENRAGDAEALAFAVLEHAQAHGLTDLPHVGYYLATAGAAIARAGRLEEGDEQLDAGIRQLGDWAPLLAAHARLMRVPVLRQLGDTDGARAALAEAECLIAQCTSTGIIGEFVPQVARTLSGSQPRSREWTAITERERGVLRLLEQGLSQREMSRQLFVSFHTIHSHMKSIYTRLGVSSRDEAIERARELDLLLPIAALSPLTRSVSR